MSSMRNRHHDFGSVLEFTLPWLRSDEIYALWMTGDAGLQYRIAEGVREFRVKWSSPLIQWPGLLKSFRHLSTLIFHLNVSNTGRPTPVSPIHLLQGSNLQHLETADLPSHFPLNQVCPKLKTFVCMGPLDWERLPTTLENYSAKGISRLIPSSLLPSGSSSRTKASVFPSMTSLRLDHLRIEDIKSLACSGGAGLPRNLTCLTLGQISASLPESKGKRGGGARKNDPDVALLSLICEGLPDLISLEVGTLSSSDSVTISEKQLSKLPTTLTRLHLSCMKYEKGHFASVPRSVTSLYAISQLRQSTDTDTFMACLAELPPNLTELDVGTDYLYGVILPQHLLEGFLPPSLTRLSPSFFKLFTAETLEQHGAKYFNNLEALPVTVKLPQPPFSLPPLLTSLLCAFPPTYDSKQVLVQLARLPHLKEIDFLPVEHFRGTQRKRSSSAQEEKEEESRKKNPSQDYEIECPLYEHLPQHLESLSLRGPFGDDGDEDGEEASKMPLLVLFFPAHPDVTGAEEPKEPQESKEDYFDRLRSFYLNTQVERQVSFGRFPMGLKSLHLGDSHPLLPGHLALCLPSSLEELRFHTSIPLNDEHLIHLSGMLRNLLILDISPSFDKSRSTFTTACFSTLPRHLRDLLLPYSKSTEIYTQKQVDRLKFLPAEFFLLPPTLASAYFYILEQGYLSGKNSIWGTMIYNRAYG